MTPDAACDVTAILHAWRWPDAAALAPLLDAVRSARSRVGVVRIIEAREQPQSAVGAAALVNAAAARAAGPLLLVLRPHLRWAAQDLAALLAAGTAGMATVGEDLWAMPLGVFEQLGGLDERFWSVGEVEDLEARASAAGIVVHRLAFTAPAIAGHPYPLHPDVHSFLAVRNRLLTAFKTLPPQQLGPATMATVRAAFVDAFEAAGLDPADFAIGASTPPTAADLRSPRRTITPLLALDSVLSEVTGVHPR